MERNNRTDIALIKRYLKGELNALEMHELERRAQQDPLLMDLMMGMEMADLGEHEVAVSAIHERIHQRLASNSEPKSATTRIWFAAATVVFALLVVGFWFLKNDRVERPVLAQKPSPAGKQEQTVSPRKTDSALLVATHPPTEKKVVKARPLTNKRKSQQLAYNGVKNTQKKPLRFTRKADALPPLSDTTVPDSMAYAVTEPIKIDSAKKEQLLAVSVSGVVTDKASNEPLPGVMVRAVSSGNATQTDSHGRFALVVPEDKKQLAVSSIGYEHQEVPVKGNDSILIAMQPANGALDEVVVVGYGKQKKGLLTGRVQRVLTNTSTDNDMTIAEARKVAKPLIGWDAYEKYLTEATQAVAGKKGTVTIAFHINEEGEPIDLFVLKGLNNRRDKQAKGIIRGGSKWEVLPKDTWVKVELSF